MTEVETVWRQVKYYVLIVVCGWAVSGAVAAERGVATDSAGARPGHAQFHAEMAQRLGLSADQQKQLAANKASHREQVRALMKAMREKRAQMQKELENDTFDRARIQVIHDETKALMNQMFDIHLEGILKIREILTADQRKKMTQHFSTMLKHRRRHDCGSNASGPGEFPPASGPDGMPVPPPFGMGSDDEPPPPWMNGQ